MSEGFTACVSAPDKSRELMHETHGLSSREERSRKTGQVSGGVRAEDRRRGKEVEGERKKGDGR